MPPVGLDLIEKTDVHDLSEPASEAYSVDEKVIQNGTPSEKIRAFASLSTVEVGGVGGNSDDATLNFQASLLKNSLRSSPLRRATNHMQ